MSQNIVNYDKCIIEPELKCIIFKNVCHDILILLISPKMIAWA